MNETAKKLEIQNSPEYIALGDQISELLEKQYNLLPVTDSYAEYLLTKDAIIDEMKATGVTGFGNVQAKFKEKKEVNRDKLLRVLEGDLDVYIALSSVTQVALKDHAKGNSKQDELMNCIEVTSREIVDVTL